MVIASAATRTEDEPGAAAISQVAGCWGGKEAERRVDRAVQPLGLPHLLASVMAMGGHEPFDPSPAKALEPALPRWRQSELRHPSAHPFAALTIRRLAQGLEQLFLRPMRRIDA
jgi:hypothetical protein